MRDVLKRIEEIKEILNEEYGFKLNDISIDITIDAVDEGAAEQLISDINHATGHFQSSTILKDMSFEASHRLIENISDKVAIRLMDAQYTIK